MCGGIEDVEKKAKALEKSMTLQVELVVPGRRDLDRPGQHGHRQDASTATSACSPGTPRCSASWSQGSVVRIRPEGDGADGEVIAAVSGGFFSVADDRVSILARQALLGAEIDTAAAQAALDAALDGGRAGRRGAGRRSATTGLSCRPPAPES